jgi:hypothetical protein
MHNNHSCTGGGGYANDINDCAKLDPTYICMYRYVYINVYKYM